MTAPDSASSSLLRGERGRPLIGRALSVQARVSNWLAMGLVLSMGIAFLCWYYLQMPGRAARERQQLATRQSARAEMPLPPLGAIEPPASLQPATVTATADVAEAPAPPAAVALEPYRERTSPPPITPPITPQVTPLERRLAGAAFVGGNSAPAESASAQSVLPPGKAVETGQVGDELSALLTSQTVHTAYARLLPSQRLLLPKGAFIDCTLETAIDSTLPGITTCVTATDTFSADGKVVLLERGTKLIGETRGQVQQASTRVFVLWTEARTPSGVVVPLDSPGADELGRSGLPGQVERHFWQRFGAAVLISLLDGGVQAAAQSVSHGNGTIIYTPSGPQEVMGEVLKGSVNIAPTVIKNNGDRIQVLAARDVDFSRVYELESGNARR